MKRAIIRVVLGLLFLVVAWFVVSAVRHWDTVQRVFLGGVHVYETQPPALPAAIKRPAILVFSKTNAFRHEEAIPAANALFAQVAKEKGWGYFQTESGAAFSPEILSRFDAVVFNNVSGDVFTSAQREAFKSWLAFGRGVPDLAAATRVWRDFFANEEEVYTEGHRLIRDAWDALA